MRYLFLLTLLLTARIATANLLPTPTKQVTEAGQFTLDSSTQISYDRQLAPLAEYLSDYLGIRANNASSCDNSVILRLEAGYKPEEYELRIRPTRIEIIASDNGGIFNGIQTLFQLLPTRVYARQLPITATIDCQTITDTPRFGYRGMMLDVCRTWMDVDKIKRYIDLFSYHKINKLHLHLSDDEGWRIEIKSHPELTEIGAFRGGDSPIRPVYGMWHRKYGGYYTQDELRELIAYAAVRNIEIIPEIDLPGHSRNIARVHPEILCRYTPDTTPSNGYDMRSAWCVAREQNYTLLEDILREVCAVFPSRYIHIGGDEVDFAQWKLCPDCRAQMQRTGITEPRLLQDQFMLRLVSILEKYGKRPAVWNESARSGSMPRTARVHGWENVKACLDATAQGYQTIVMPGAYFYLDMRQSPREDGHDWAAIFDAKKMYSFDLATNGFTPEQMSNVIGMQGAFFSEAYISHNPEKNDYLDYMCFPRLCVLSQMSWHGTTEGWNVFYAGLQKSHYDRMAAMGITFRLFPPTVTYRDGKLTVTTTDSNAQTIYKIIGDATSHRYTRPIATDRPHRYLFRTEYKTGNSPVVGDASYYRTITPALKLTTSMGEDAKIRYTNVEQYKTFARTARACRKGDWILYEFATPIRCREIYLQTGNRQLPKTIVTTGYVEISHDGKRFVRIVDLEKGSAIIQTADPVCALRIVSTCDDNGCAYVTIQPPQIKPIL